MTLFKPRVRPELTSPTIFNPPPPTTAITDLDPGTDYRVVMPSTPYNGRLWLRGGRKVHIGWGATPSAYGGEIRVTTGNTSCLIVEDMEECWIEGIVALKYDGSGNPSQGGNCFQIRCTNTSFPVYILNCYGAGMVADPAIRGAAIVHVRNGTCPNLVIDGLTGLTYAEGILMGLGLDSAGASVTNLSMTRVNLGWGNDFPRVLGNLIAIDPPTAQYFDTYLVDKAAPTAAIAPLYDGTRDTTDTEGNLIFGPTTGIDGTLWKGEPPAGDWVSQAECGLNYVAPGYETGSALPATTADKLLYHPDFVVPLTSPTTTDVGASGGTVTLGAGDHRIITLNSGTAAVTGNVTINGVAGSGNRIRIIGGQITNATENATAASHCLRINNVDYVYIEGVKGAKGNTAGSFINLAGTWKLCVVQNCRGIGINSRAIALGHAFDQFGKFFEAETRGGLILMDRLTGDTWSEGIIFNSSLSPASSDPNYEGVILSRVNCRVNDTALNPIQPADTTHPLFYLQNCCGTSCRLPVWLLDVWGYDEQASGPATIAQMVSPSTIAFGNLACGANYDSVNLRVTWPVANRITGFISYGIPPGGDFVPDTFTGLDYETPGYAGVPIPAVQRGAYALTLDHTPTAAELLAAAAAARGTTPPAATDSIWFGIEPGTGVINRGIALDGAFAEHSTVPVRLPAPGAPAFLTPPTALADTVSGGQVGVQTSVLFNALTDNDLFDPRTRSVIASSVGSAVGCTVTVDDDSVNYTPTQQSPVSFSATMQDSKGGTSSATVTVTDVLPGTPPPEPTPTGSFYGCPYTGTSLGELESGQNSSNREVYVPWRAPKTGNIVSLRFYLLATQAGYAEGTGGNCRIRLVQATGSGINTRPTEIQVGTGEYTFTGMANHPNRPFPRVVFSSPIPVVAGTLYYIQHHNTHSVPENNWYSADVWSANWNTSAGTVSFRPYTPFRPDEDMQCFYKNDTATTYTQHVSRSQQVCELEYSDGTFAGYPMRETWASSGTGTFPQTSARNITASQWHRQRFTNTPALTLTHVSVASKATSGTANLILEVRDSGMTVLRTVNFPASAFPATTTGQLFATPVALSSAFTIAAGSTFYVTTRTTGSTVYRCTPAEDGQLTGSGFHQDFGGFCEYSTNSGSSWSGGWPSKSGNISSVAKLPICFLRT